MKLKKVNELFGEIQNEQTQWMFAYGSLSSTKLRYLLLENVSSVIPCKISKELGYKRKWIQNRSLNSVTSGIFKVDNPIDINGLIFPIVDNDFIKLDEYELGYKRYEMSWDSILIDNKEKYTGQKLWIYIPDQEYIKPELFFSKLPAIYVDYCMDGFREISEDYMIEFARTTD
jgi:hypothetical protein